MCVNNTINQYSYIIAEKDPDFKKALFALLMYCFRDGIGIVEAVKVLLGKKIKKVAGGHLHHYLLEKLESEGGRCFTCLSEKHLRKLLVSVMEFPAIKAGFYSPPYKSCFDDDDNLKMINAVNSFRPTVLFMWE